MEENNSKVKEVAGKVLGAGNREEYDNTRDYVSQQIFKNGFLGTVSGVLIGTAAVLGHVFHVVVGNMLFGEANHLNLTRAFMEAVGTREKAKEARELDKKNKEQKNEQKKKERDPNNRDPKKRDLEERDPKNRNQEKGEDFSAEENEFRRELQAPAPDIEETTVIKSTEVKEDLEELKNNTDIFLSNPERLDKEISKILKIPAVEVFFKEYNLIPVADHSSENIILFKEGRENDLQEMAAVTKEDLLTGNAQAIANALMDRNLKDGRKPNLAAAADAVILSAKIKNEINSAIYADIRSEMNDKDMIPVSYAVVDATNNTAGLLYSVLSSERDAVQMYYKNEYVGTIDLYDSYRKNSDIIHEKITHIDKGLEKNVYTINENVSFKKHGNEEVDVIVNGDTKTFPLKEECDMKAVADFIAEKCPEKGDLAQIDAMLITAKVNPYIDKSLDEEGYPLNPFTDKVVEPGDLVLSNTDGYPQICEYTIGINPSIGISACQVEEIKPIVNVPTDGIGYDMASLEEEIDVYVEEQKNAEISEMNCGMNAMIFGEVDAHVKRPMELPNTVDAVRIYDQLKTEALLDGKDISSIRISEEKGRENNFEPDLDTEERSFEEEYDRDEL